uniref:Uncharacterized protein n=1 Tax=Panagrolaimus davidi TaxID=227884 RepID=A0A914PZL7_9BILA
MPMCVQNIYILFLDKPGTTEYSETKTCGACVSYMCTVNGKQIMYGNGCFEDFDKTCGNIATIDKNVVKDNLNNSFHYGKNFVAASCSHADNCAEAELELYPLTVQEQINHNAAVFEAQNSSSNASLNVYLFWMIISGIILFYLW